MTKDIFQFQSIVDRLICPVCNHKVTCRDNSLECRNVACGRTYPLINRIPILINEEDSLFTIEQFVATNNATNLMSARNSLAKRIYAKIVPNISNNLSSKDNFILLEKLLANIPTPKILIIGGATITTDTERIIKPQNVVIESDIYIGPRTQIIIDGHHIPFEDETFDLIIYQAVLEHVVDPYQCVKEAHRVLNKDGIVFSATPFMQQVHMKQNDFTRFTYLGHRRLFRGFEQIDSGIFAGTGVALAWSVKYFGRSLTDNKILRNILQLGVSFLFFWLKYVDHIIVKNKGAYDGASGFYFIGRKSDRILEDKDLIKLYKGII